MAGAWSPTRTGRPSASSVGPARDHDRRFAELAAAIRVLPVMTLILDGEVAIFDDTLISRFEWFRKRPEDVAATPPIYMAFDCLYLEGRDLRDRPLRERRVELERVLENDQVLLFPARRLETDGFEAWAQVVERGYEGLVGKDQASPTAKAGHSRGSR